MPRIRTIKPDFFKNEILAELPFTCRLLFIGLWTQADKEGRMEDRPKRLKAELFPYDNLNIDDLLSRLQSAGFIIRYEVSELKVIQIINFTKHQRITGSEADSDSLLPGLPEGNTEETLRKHFGNTQDDRKGKEGKGKERKGKEFIAPACEEVEFYFQENGYSIEAARKAHEYYSTANWTDSKGNKVRNWKQKMIAVWFKEENKKEKSCAKKEKSIEFGMEQIKNYLDNAG